APPPLAGLRQQAVENLPPPEDLRVLGTAGHHAGRAQEGEHSGTRQGLPCAGEKRSSRELRITHLVSSIARSAPLGRAPCHLLGAVPMLGKADPRTVGARTRRAHKSAA